MDSCLEEGFFNSPKKVVHTCPKVDPSITVVLEVLHLLKDLFVARSICLEVAVVEFPFVLVGLKVLFELSGSALGKSQTKKGGPEFSVHSTNLSWESLGHVSAML